jgi:hypothetical protein
MSASPHRTVSEPGETELRPRSAEPALPDPRVQAVLGLQRSAGNAAAARLLQRQGDATAAPPASELATLRELLARWDPPEEEVIAVMGRLAPADVATVLGDATLKRQASGCLTDEEMHRAVKAMNGDLVKSLEWMFAEGTHWTYLKDVIASKPGEIANVATAAGMQKGFVAECSVEELREATRLLALDVATRDKWLEAAGLPPRFKFVDTATKEAGGVKLDPDLHSRLRSLVELVIDEHMVTEDPHTEGDDGVRAPADAHRMSTAYNIRDGAIPLEALKALPDGKDADGTVWYEEGWSRSEIIANATKVWPGARANEGYPEDDPRRLPNGLKEPKMSMHCTGRAWDVTIRWADGDGWHAQANKLVADFGLIRPEPDEHWHFELPQ